MQRQPIAILYITAFFDLYEYIFHLDKGKVIDDVVWNHWKAFMETTMTIPKFRRVWQKTKYSYSEDQFKSFIDSLSWSTIAIPIIIRIRPSAE